MWLFFVVLKIFLLSYILCISITPVWAQVLPSSADPARVDDGLLEKEPLKQRLEPLVVPKYQFGQDIPPESKNIRLTLEGIKLDGATAFPDEHIHAMYKHLVGKDTTLDKVWAVANDITNYYRDAGFFLSRAYVPAQSIVDGIVRINVVEGYISRVDLSDDLRKHGIVRRLISGLEAEHPVSRQQLESFLLRLNDFPGYSFNALLKRDEIDGNGGVALLLEHVPEQEIVSLGVNNYGSKFLGPIQMNTSYRGTLVPLQETVLSVAASLPADELKNVNLSHQIQIAPSWKILLSGSATDTEPGSNLAVNRINGDSVTLQTQLIYSLKRQRNQNVDFKLGIGGRHSNTEISGNTLVRDRLRTLHLGSNVSFIDDTGAYNQFAATLSKGLKFIDASDGSDLNLSRTGAQPDFTKLDASYLRQQMVMNKFLIQTQVEGQYSNNSLFSSEEFGFGGARLGRAFDASEITGDSGIAAGVELHYTGVELLQKTHATPFIFYDIGRVWNQEPGRKSITASSTGAGVRLSKDVGKKARISADFFVAVPIIKSIDNPIIGDKHSPRVGFRLSISR